MTNRDELIKKYIRQQLSASEKEEFDHFLNNDDDFATDVQLASKLTTARHERLDESLNIYQKKRRLWQYLGFTALLLMVVSLYFFRGKRNETPLILQKDKEGIVPKNNWKIDSSLVKKDTFNVLPNNQGVHQIELKSPIKSQKDPSVQKPKKASEKLQVAVIIEDSLYLQAFISKIRGEEMNAGKSQNDWRTLLFSNQYPAALTVIRQELPATTDEISLNKLHLYGGILNASIPEGNRQEAIKWLKAVIDNGDYADYAAMFLIKTYVELNQIEAAKKLLAQYPDVKDKLPLHLQKRL